MAEMTKDPNFSYNTPDSKGVVPDPSLLGKMLLHSGNGKTYIIHSFAWLGETDEWGFIHATPKGPLCCRPLSHIDGNRENGEPRYHRLDAERSAAIDPLAVKTRVFVGGGEIFYDKDGNRIDNNVHPFAKAELSRLAPGQGDQGYPEDERNAEIDYRGHSDIDNTTI